MHILYINGEQSRDDYQLCEEPNGRSIGVLCKDGTTELVKWCGFMPRYETTKHRNHYKPVKLVVARVNDRVLSPGEYVHGCLTSKGVYGILDGTVAIVKKERNC